MNNKAKSERTLGAILYNDFELLDLYGPLEMFGNVGPGLKIVTVAEKPGAIKSAQGPSTVADLGFDDCNQLDLILVPGGIGTQNQLSNSNMLNFLREQAKKAEIIMSVCTGSAILSKAGILDGYKATSNKLFFDFSAGQNDKVHWISEARWVEDGPVATASGVSAGTDMALGVISKLFGKERAERISVLTEYEWHTDSNRDPFIKHLNKGDINELLSILGRT